MKLKSDDTVIPFEDLIIEMYNNKDNWNYLVAVNKYLSKYNRGYCLVHLYTLESSLRGYFEKLKCTM